MFKNFWSKKDRKNVVIEGKGMFLFWIPNLFSHIKSEFSKFSVREMIEFIRRLDFEKTESDRICDIIKENKYDGKKLTNMSYLEFSRIFTNSEMKKSSSTGRLSPRGNKKKGPEYNEVVAKKLKFSLFSIKIQKTYSQVWFNVFKKVVNQSLELNPTGATFRVIRDIVEKFTDKKIFYETHFAFYVECYEFLEMKREYGKKLKADNMSDSQKKKKEKELYNKKKLVEKYYKKLTGIDSDEDVNVFEESTFAMILRKRNYRIPVKLIVTDIYDEQQSFQKNIRKLVSPVVSQMEGIANSLKLKFGLFHTALIIGPWYLSWDNSSIIAPGRSFKSKKALLTTDIPNIKSFEMKDFRYIAEIVCDLVYKWNTQHLYSTSESDLGGNCQHFVDDILIHTDISIDDVYVGYLGKVIRKLRKKGKHEMEFVPNESFKETFKLKEKKYKFPTHEDLDNFVIELQEKYVLFEANFTEEYLLLKSFDRAFWLRFQDSPKNKKYIPKKDPEYPSVFLCPFSDPNITSSFI